MVDVCQVLKDVFGHNGFKSKLQQSATEAIIRGEFAAFFL